MTRDDGAKEEFTRLYRDHSYAIKRYTLRRLDDPKSCEDVVSETFLVAWRRWAEVPSREHELPWLYGIAFRLLSNQRRARDRRKRLQVRLSMERAPLSLGDEAELPAAAIVKGALTQLRDADRSLLELVYWEKLTYREIAQVTGISENAVGIRITRAKKNLRVRLSLPTSEVPNPNSGRGLES